MRIILFLLLSCCSLPLMAGQVYQWTDENGRRHFGESIPERYKSYGSLLNLKEGSAPSAQTTTPSPRTAAPTTAKKPASLQATPANEEEPKQPTEMDRCHAAMQRYRESVECFEHYKNQNGSFKPGAFENCQSLPQPIGCTNF